jgi:hypothetical protein
MCTNHWSITGSLNFSPALYLVDVIKRLGIYYLLKVGTRPNGDPIWIRKKFPQLVSHIFGGRDGYLSWVFHMEKEKENLSGCRPSQVIPVLCGRPTEDRLARAVRFFVLHSKYIIYDSCARSGFQEWIFSFPLDYVYICNFSGGDFPLDPQR